MKVWLLFALLFLTAHPALAEDRVALLIGNSNYDNPALSLKNPANDATAMAEKLRGIGFDVTVVADASGTDMETALEAFREKMAGADVALFYYAGHGIEVEGENYLIAADFAGLKDGGLAQDAMPVARVRDAMAVAGPRVGLIILDACRNNPFADSGATLPGLARAQGALGLLIAFAAEPNKVAFDGAGDNSVFTQALLDNIATDGLEVRIMLGRVRQQVALVTHGSQAPLVEDGTLGENYLGAPVAEAAAADAFATEMTIWRVASASADPGPMQEYLSKYPDGLFASFAKDRIAALQGGAKGATDTGVITGLRESDKPKVASALEQLGFLSVPDRSLPPPDDQIAQAFAAYASSLPVPADAGLALLFHDAARQMTYLAAATAQRLRTDLVALTSVERTYTLSQGMLAEMKALAAKDPNAEPILTAAEADVAGIAESRDHILSRLDGTRTYYDDQLKTAYRYFGAEVADITAELDSGSQQQSDIERTLTSDVRQFARQIAEMTPDTEATMAWLADFLPKQ